MHVYVATSLLDSSAKKVHISDHSNKIVEFWSSPRSILLTIVIGVVLLYLYWPGKSEELNFNYTNKVDEEEPEELQLVNESDRDFDWDDQQFCGRNTEHGGALRRHVPCAFCGDESTTRCARCKVARYCSVECQIGHWRSRHRHECFGRETEEEGEARDVHGHQIPMLVENYDNESISNGSYGNGVELMSSNVEILDGSSSSSDVNNSHVGCEQCGSPSTTRCSRCKVVRYCSTMCLITNWKWHKYNCIPGDASSSPTERPNRNEEEENIHSSLTPLYLELHPEGTSNFKSPTKVSQITTTKENHKTRSVKHLEDELVKSRKEIFAIQSERDLWKKAANIAKERFQSFKEESEKHLSALRNENESISKAEKKACDVIHSLQLQIAAQENIAEKKRRLEEYTFMLESECAKLKKELQEEHKHAQYLTLEYNKSNETTQIAIREVEAIKQELLEERDKTRDFIRDVTVAESRAIYAEAKFSDLQRKIKLTNYKPCTICLTNEKDMAFGCGHMTCRDCGSQLRKCPICREQITSHIKLFPG